MNHIKDTFWLTVIVLSALLLLHYLPSTIICGHTLRKVDMMVSDRLTPSINFQYAFLSLPAKRILWYIGH